MTREETAARTAIIHWEHFWFEAIPPHIYSLLRIVFGLLGIVALVCLSDWPTFWDLDGFVALDPWAGLKSYFQTHRMGALAGRLLYVACLAAFAAMTVGYRSGIAVTLGFAAAVAQVSWSYFPLSGAHSVMIGVLFCLLWADCGAVWSMDAWLERRSNGPTPKEEPTGSIAPLRLIRYQVAVIYLTTGFWKLFSPLWRDGSAVHYVLNQNVFQRFTDTFPPGVDWLATVGTFVTLVWELAFAGMMLFRSTRTLALALGIVLHVGMLFSIDVGIFSLVMLASYIAFVDARTVPVIWQRLSAQITDKSLRAG